ncbi:unnamed protein product [Prunus armeniaca]|uniref:Uncharacterized protein n=1 Tax=Prunus armeniaca TaxID=36596 RepID=A0A6J5X7X5_PRUAR|nr:unnamed protein product [Prunus armeniaca]
MHHPLANIEHQQRSYLCDYRDHPTLPRLGREIGDLYGQNALHMAIVGGRANVVRKKDLDYVLLDVGWKSASKFHEQMWSTFDIDRSIKESSIASPRDEMKKMRNEIREKLIQEAPECTAPDSIQVPLDAEFGIMGEKLGRRGRSTHGVGVFPCMETSSSSTPSSMASSSKLSAIYDQLKMLSTNLVTLQKENEDLRAQLRSVLTASHGQTSTSSRGSNGVHIDDDYYDELANQNLDEN